MSTPSEPPVQEPVDDEEEFGSRWWDLVEVCRGGIWEARSQLSDVIDHLGGQPHGAELRQAVRDAYAAVDRASLAALRQLDGPNPLITGFVLDSPLLRPVRVRAEAPENQPGTSPSD